MQKSWLMGTYVLWMMWLEAGTHILFVWMSFYLCRYLFLQIFEMPVSTWYWVLYFCLWFFLTTSFASFSNPTLLLFNLLRLGRLEATVSRSLVPLDGLVEIRVFFFPFSSFSLPSSSSHPFWFSCWLSWTLYLCCFLHPWVYVSFRFCYIFGSGHY